MTSSGLPPETLTRRENDILALLGQNLSDRQIAERLVLSVNSVKWYARQVYAKLGVSNRQEAVQKAREFSLLTAEEAQLKKPINNLPRRLSSFIGREKEIAQVVRMVRENPLVTLTGAGGVGKTRLAQEAAAVLVNDFANGIWYIELASLSDSQLLAQTLAGRIGIRETQDRPLLDSILSYFANRHALLVLDNCEHMVTACADLVQVLLTALPRLKILITSREPLLMSGEAVFRVPSLPYPADITDPDIERCMAFESVRLFVDRARVMSPGFQLTPLNAAPVAYICRRLDGIPLAIELAAARTRMMALEEIASRLDHAFSLLTYGSRSALPRHQTLSALIDWSYALLSPDEQVLLLRLSVFAGGWVLKAAEQVCCAAKEDDGVQSAQIVDLLGRLVDKSLVQFEPFVGNEPRYHLLETVRQFASARLAACGAEADVRQRHLAFYTALAVEAEPHLRGWQSNDWLARLEQELDNLRKALEWSTTAALEKGMQLAVPLVWFWMLRNHQVEGAGWLDRLLLKQKERGDLSLLDRDSKVARGRALNALNVVISGTTRGRAINYRLSLTKEELDQESKAIFAELGENFQREYALSLFLQEVPQQDILQFLLECHQRFQAVQDRFWLAECDLGLCNTYWPDFERARFYGEESLALRKELGDIDGEGGTLRHLADIELHLGNIARYIELHKASIACLETIGDRWYVALYRASLAKFFIDQGDYQEAGWQLEMICSLAEELNEQEILYEHLKYQGYMAWGKREYDLAVHFSEQALQCSRNFQLYLRFLPFYILARVALVRGELARAITYLKNFLDLQIISDDWRRIQTFHALGILAFQQGQMQQFTTFFGARDAVGDLYGWAAYSLIFKEREEYAEALEAARVGLGIEAFTAAWEAGRTMTREQIVQYGLEFITESQS